MDLVRILRSLEEFLYEVMTWLVFYPRMLLRTVTGPIGVMAYSRAEMEKPNVEDRYADAISPPLFLILTMVVGHLIEIAADLHPGSEVTGPAAGLFASDQSLVIIRSLMFALFPLVFAIQQMKVSGVALTREGLRGPFFGACFPAAAFCLVVSLGATLQQLNAGGPILGQGVSLAAALWYLVVQYRWLRGYGAGRARAAVMVIVGFLQAATVVLFVGAALVFSR